MKVFNLILDKKKWSIIDFAESILVVLIIKYFTPNVPWLRTIILALTGLVWTTLVELIKQSHGDSHVKLPIWRITLNAMQNWPLAIPAFWLIFKYLIN